MAEHFNRLTPAQAERLAILGEECGELVQAVGKIQRHGYASANPFTGVGNVEQIEAEIADVFLAADGLVNAGDLSRARIARLINRKREAKRRWLHHQDEAPREIAGDPLVAAWGGSAEPDEEEEGC